MYLPTRMLHSVSIINSVTILIAKTCALLCAHECASLILFACLTKSLKLAMLKSYSLLCGSFRGFGHITRLYSILLGNIISGKKLTYGLVACVILCGFLKMASHSKSLSFQPCSAPPSKTSVFAGSPHGERRI